MNIKDFLSYFDFSKLDAEHILIIPIIENNLINIKNPLKCIIDNNKKIILDDYKYGFIENYDFFVDRFGIKPHRQSLNENDEEYDYLDFNDLGNHFYSIQDQNGTIYIIHEIIITK